MRPTKEVKRAAQDALDDWITWETFDHNFPTGGGLDNQESEWIDAITAVSQAHNRAEDELQREAQEIAEARRNKK